MQEKWLGYERKITNFALAPGNLKAGMTENRKLKAEAKRYA